MVLPDAVKTVAVVTLEAQVNAPLEMTHFPLLEESVKPEPFDRKLDFVVWAQREKSGTANLPLVVAVNDAHVPLVYQVPPLMMHPFEEPPEVTCKVPFPEIVPVPVGAGEVVVVVTRVVVALEVVPLGRYLIPVAGHVDFEPSGPEATKDPLATDPCTAKA